MSTERKNFINIRIGIKGSKNSFKIEKQNTTNGIIVCSLVNSEAERVYLFCFNLIIGKKTKRDTALFKTPKSNS